MGGCIIITMESIIAISPRRTHFAMYDDAMNKHLFAMDLCIFPLFANLLKNHQ